MRSVRTGEPILLKLRLHFKCKSNEQRAQHKQFNGYVWVDIAFVRIFNCGTLYFAAYTMHCQWQWRMAASMWSKFCIPCGLWATGGGCRTGTLNWAHNKIYLLTWHVPGQLVHYISLSMFAPFTGPKGHGCAPIYIECNLAVERNIPFHISYFILFHFVFFFARYGAGQIRLTQLISTARQMTYIRSCAVEG